MVRRRLAPVAISSMTRKEIAKRLLAIHGAVSLTFMLLISWSIWTGILSIYADLARPWLRADVAAAYAAAPSSPSDVLAFVHGPHTPPQRWNLVAPTPMRPFYVYAGPAPRGGAPIVLMTNPRTGLKDTWNNMAVDGVFRRLHTDLLLPKPWGRLTMGVAGVLIVILVATGLFIHGKQIRDAWRWRRRSRLLDLSESHKRFGLWLTPFLLLMGLTGAILGMKIVVAPLGQWLEGTHAVAAPRSETLVVRPDRVDRCVRQALRRMPGTRFAGLDRNGALLRVRLLRSDTLQWPGEGGGSVAAQCDLPGGSLTIIQARPSEGVWGTIESALRPIHYARFGGIGIIIVYLLLSVLCLWLIDTGMRLLWHRDQKASRVSVSERLYHANNRLYVVLPLILLGGNLLLGSTPWLVLVGAVAVIVAASLAGHGKPRFPIWLTLLIPIGYAGLVLIRTMTGTSASFLLAPVVVTNVSLLALSGWLGQHLLASAKANAAGARRAHST